MKIAVVGSREYQNLLAVQAYIQLLPADTVIISGGARGVDKTAELAAKARGLRTLIYPAQWDKYGKRAGFVRNELMINDADEIVAFWDGQSNGTKHSILLAQQSGKPLLIVRGDE